MSSGLTEPYKAAIDGSGNAWISNYANRAVVELSPSGAVLSGAGGYAIGATGTGAFKLAVDGSGDVWSSNGSGNSIGELIGAATPVITPIAAGLPATPTVDGSSSLGTRP
jgi:streptogramin lyase